METNRNQNHRVPKHEITYIWSWIKDLLHFNENVKKSKAKSEDPTWITGALIRYNQTPFITTRTGLTQVDGITAAAADTPTSTTPITQTLLKITKISRNNIAIIIIRERERHRKRKERQPRSLRRKREMNLHLHSEEEQRGLPPRRNSFLCFPRFCFPPFGG